METDVLFDELLTNHEVAEVLKVSVNTVDWWRCQGKGPRYIKLGKGLRSPVRYRRTDLEAYLAFSIVGGGHDGAE